MQIVIDIPEEEYDMFRIMYSSGMGNSAVKRILNGTILPKHGRLIDADDVLTQTQKSECENSFELGKEYGWNKAIEYVGNFAPTVIEGSEE